MVTQSFLQAGWSVGELWAYGLSVRPATFGNHLVLNRDEERLGERGVQRLLAKFSALVGITKRIRPHSLRHTFVSFKAEAGVSLFQLQQCLGHNSLHTTIYVHLMRKNAKKVMRRQAYELTIANIVSFGHLRLGGTSRGHGHPRREASGRTACDCPPITAPPNAGIIRNPGSWSDPSKTGVQGRF